MCRKSRRLKLSLLLLAILAETTVLGAGGMPAEALGTVCYDVRYKLGGLATKVATATIGWEKSSWNGIPAFHSKAVVKPTPVFRLFISSDYLADTYFSQKSVAPLYFVNPFKHNGQDGRFEYVFEEGKKIIESTTVLGDQAPQCKEFPLDGRTMDLLSLLHFIRFLDLKDGKAPLGLNILMAGKSYAAQLSGLGSDPDKFPGQPAEHLLLRMTERGLMENGSGNEIHIWRAATADRRILGLEVDLSSGRMVCTVRESE